MANEYSANYAGSMAGMPGTANAQAFVRDHRMVPGYTYVPVQNLTNLYDQASALASGTIFPELDIGIMEYTRGID